MRKFLFVIFLFILIDVVVECVSFGGLYYLKRSQGIEYRPVDKLSDRHRRILKRFLRGETKYIEFNSTLGWRIKSNGLSPLYQANTVGIRSDKDYAIRSPENVLRIATFGDSFTHCDEVGNDETWQVVLEEKDPQLEVLNYGVGGFGLDQAYLRYLEEGSRLHPEIVIIGFMSENIFRHVNIFRPFYRPGTGAPLAKPRFAVKGEKITLVTNPLDTLSAYRDLLEDPGSVLPGLGEEDYFYQRRYKSSPLDFLSSIRLAKIARATLQNDRSMGILVNGVYDTESEAFRVTTKIFDDFYRNVIKNGSQPVILVFPKNTDIQRYRMLQTKRYRPLLEYFEGKGYRHLDLMEAFFSDGASVEDSDFSPTHYSASVNRLVAEFLYRKLMESDLRP